MSSAGSDAPLILVTGAAGFIGRHLCATLARSGLRVRALDRAPYENAPAGVEIVRAALDRQSGDALQTLLAGCESVVHLAAISSLWLPRADDFLRVNAFASARLAKAARQAGVRRFLYVSTLTAMIGGPPGGEALTIDEGLRLHPDETLGPYPRTKRLGEILVLSENAPEFQVSILTPTLPLGPGDRNLTAPTRLACDLARGALPALLDTPMNFIDVRDLVAAIAHALALARGGETYLLGGEDVMLTEFAREIANLMGRAPVTRTIPAPLALTTAWLAETFLAPIMGRAPQASLTGVRVALRPRLVDSSKARNALGLATRPRLATLRDTLDWLALEGLTPARPASSEAGVAAAT